MGRKSLCFSFSSISYHRQNGLELDYVYQNPVLVLRKFLMYIWGKKRFVLFKCRRNQYRLTLPETKL